MAAKSTIYSDIATRTGGDIYIGVVGPVRSGKSTFIKRFMESVVLPQMEDGGAKDRATDEMPQSGSGKTVMTTEPKFVPDEAVRIKMDGELGFRVKLIDCVGFPVPGAAGLEDEGKARMVNTPWSEEPLPFEAAATLGTQKVISEHSTVGIVVTTDGSIGELPRDAYLEAEERVIREMKASGKPFVVILNSQHPEHDETKKLSQLLEEKYKVPILSENCFLLTESEILEIIRKIVLEFPIRQVKAKLPSWVFSLQKDHPIRIELIRALDEGLMGIKKTGEIFKAIDKMTCDEKIHKIHTSESDLGKGSIELDILVKSEIFFSVMSEETGLQIRDEEALIGEVKKLASMKEKYDKIAKALDEVEESGYGIVTPSIEDLKLEEPEIVKQSGSYGVKLKASAPSIHMIRANIQAEISPIVGSERQSEDMVKFLLEEFEEDPAKIWQSNMFGKSLYELVNEGLNTKLNHMPSDARAKLAETLQKIINEGSGGLICIIL